MKFIKFIVISVLFSFLFACFDGGKGFTHYSDGREIIYPPKNNTSPKVCPLESVNEDLLIAVDVETPIDQSVSFEGAFYSNLTGECGSHLLLGLPNSPSQVICKEGFAIGYNYENRLADWVSYELTDSSVQASFSRSDNFKADTVLPESYRVSSEDYLNSGFDRGHIAPAATVDFSESSMEESFLMSNIMPQNPTLNRGIWAQIEQWVRDCTVENTKLMVITGTIVPNNPELLNNKVAVPSHVYKVIIKPSSPAKALAFLIPNKAPEDNFEIKDYITTIEYLERITGKTFLSNVVPSISSQLRTKASEICDIPNYDDAYSQYDIQNVSTQVNSCDGTITPNPINDPTNPNTGCCRVCRAGKACGDGCISLDKQCTLPIGCACNG